MSTALSSETISQSTAETLGRSVLGTNEDVVTHEPVVEVLWHYDLSMIGAQWYPSVQAGETARVIGRREPEFIALEDDRWCASARRRSLNDPCISRQQLELKWHQRDGLFEVRAPDASKLSVQLMTLGTPDERVALGANWTQARPGTLVLIGDRVLLSLDRRPVWPGVGDGTLDEVPVIRRVRGQARALPEETPGHLLLGDSQIARSLLQQLWQLSRREEPLVILLVGETGSGKEVIGRIFHELCQWQREGRRWLRQPRPFVVTNCGVLDESLINSELFGHERGAFTGAERRHLGVFERADEGVVFLDEIGELPLSLQPRLLRVLTEKQLRRIGGEREIPFSTHILAATNRDLDQQVRSGAFREDLYHRLKVFVVDLPPLRARRVDIPRIFRWMFLDMMRFDDPEQAGRADPSSASFERLWQRAVTNHGLPIPMEVILDLMARAWRGNFRELRAHLHRLVVLNQERSGPFVTLDAEDAPEESVRLVSPGVSVQDHRMLDALRASSWRFDAAAEALEISKSALVRRVSRRGLFKQVPLQELQEGFATTQELIEALGVSRAVVYRWLSQLGAT